jgi:hypothetical protein
MVYTTQNYCVSTPGSVSVLKRGEGDALLGSLEREKEHQSLDNPRDIAAAA